ncbi:hypothetical protein [Terrisporobacter petrolearius]|uniref:hypothetical protein n=1 Tax=Terrisporobacter petrolearius TaxID=1460447 RepID=UPI0031CCD7E8
MNYQLELENYLYKIYNEKIYQILIKEDLSKLKNMDLNEIKSLLNSKEIYLGSDLDDYIINLIPEGFKGYLLRKNISKKHNLTYPLLYNEDGKPLKVYTHNSFSTVLWEDFTNKTFIKDLNNKFSCTDFYNYVNENIHIIYSSIIHKIEAFKNDNVIIIPYKSDHLVNTVKEMILSKKLDFSYALSFVDMDKLREEMESFAIDLSYYDEFDKLEDDLEECLNNFFRYNDRELYDLLINKENFTLIDKNKLVKKI